MEPTPLGIKYPPMIKSFWVTLPFPGNTGYNLVRNIYLKFHNSNYYDFKNVYIPICIHKYVG